MSGIYDPKASDAAFLKALESLRDCLLPDRRFPTNVFRDSWSSFYFFDSDSIFEPEFVTIVNSLLTTEGGVYACVVNLDQLPLENRRSVFFVNPDVTTTEYGVFLRGREIEEGWIYGMDRFACISNLRHWCIYCEKANEIAVIALRDKGSLQKLTEALSHLGGLPIAQGISAPPSYGLSARALSLDWRHQLLRYY